MLDHAGPFLVQGKFTDIISLKNVLSLDKPRPEVARFSFRDWKTKRQVTMDDFTLTFFDLDHGYGNGGVEELKFEGDWVQAVVAEDTSILVHELEGDTGAIHFKSTEESLKPDEPKNPKVLTPRQFNKAVSLKFRKSHSFIVTLMVTTKSPSPRFFSFVGEASILCARDFQGVKLPVGEVYFNSKALEKDLETAGAPMWSTFLGFLGAGLGLMVLVALAGLLYVCMNAVPQGYVQMACEEEKQGPGLFWVAIPAGAGVRLGLLLDAPDGINQPPMINDQRSLGWWCSPKVQQQQTSTCFGALRCHHHLWRCVRSRRSSGKPLWRFARRAHTSTRSSTEASAKTARFFGGKARCPGGFYGGSDHGNFPRWASCAMELSESQTSSQQRW